MQSSRAHSQAIRNVSAVVGVSCSIDSLSLRNLSSFLTARSSRESMAPCLARFSSGHAERSPVPKGVPLNQRRREDADRDEQDDAAKERRRRRADIERIRADAAEAIKAKREEPPSNTGIDNKGSGPP